MGDGAQLPSVSVVIPSLPGGQMLVDLVRSLLIDGAAEVLIADNGLPEPSRALLRDANARIVPMGRNLGFGTAVNRAVSASEGSIIVVLNDDLEPLDGFLTALVAPIIDGAEMAAGVLLQKRAPDLIETAGIEIDRTLAASDYLQNEPVARLEEPLRPPLGPCGAAAAYRRSAFVAVNGFDENFFIYGEDVDLAIRLRAAGGRCALAAGARAVHAGSGTTGYGSLSKANIVGFSRGYLLRKYGVLSTLSSGPAALAAETAAVLVLAGHHRSLKPALARVRGWRSCKARCPRPPKSDITVGYLNGLRRRYVRFRMPSSTVKTLPGR